MRYLTLIILFLTPFIGYSNDTLAIEEQAPEVDMAAAQIEEGGAIFKKLCKACHAIDQRLVGPPLKGVSDRHDEAWIINFVQNSTAVIEGGDEYAIQLFQDYNQVPMPPQPVTADEIRSVIAYINAASIPQVGKNPIPRPVVQKSNVKPLKFSDYRFWIIYTITVGLLIIGVYYKAEMEALKKKLNDSGES